jgi:hypothetical protein
MSEIQSALARELGSPLSPGLAALDDEDMAALVALIEDSRAHQKRALAQAIDNGLTIVPRFLRGTVRKALFG